MAAEVYRTLPAKLAGRISEHGLRRVLETPAAKLERRNLAELTYRIARNWDHWRNRLTVGEPVRDPVALAIRLTRRGMDCPDVRCEDGYQFDLDLLCKACALAAPAGAATSTRLLIKPTPTSRRRATPTRALPCVARLPPAMRGLPTTLRSPRPP